MIVKIKIFFACVLGLALVIIPITIGHSQTLDTNAEKWGKILVSDYKYSKNNNKVHRVDQKNNNIALKGKRATLSNRELEKATNFYILSGESENEAQENALNYCKEYEALYEEAISKGFSTNDQEIDICVTNMKNNFNDPSMNQESKEQLNEIISQFNTEDQYWEYEKTILEKDIPINKLNENLEKEFYNNNKNVTEEDFSKYFENYKKSLVEKEDYKLISQNVK